MTQTAQSPELMERWHRIKSALGRGHRLQPDDKEWLLAVARKGIEAQEDWYPIETAPKKDKNWTIQIAYRAGNAWCIRQGWWSGEPGVWTDGLNRYRPSHWRYLPQGPS